MASANRHLNSYPLSGKDYDAFPTQEEALKTVRELFSSLKTGMDEVEYGRDGAMRRASSAGGGREAADRSVTAELPKSAILIVVRCAKLRFESHKNKFHLLILQLYPTFFATIFMTKIQCVCKSSVITFLKFKKGLTVI